MKIRLIACMMAAALAICTSSRLLGQSTGSYTITDLGTLYGVQSEGYGVNQSGQAVGAVWTTQVVQRVPQSHAFLWENGALRDLGTLGMTSTGSTVSAATAINGRGQIVGVATTAQNSRHAFLFENGVMTDLGTLGGASSDARSINALGQVVGTAQTSDGGSRAVVWQDGGIRALDTGGAGPIFPYDINASGQVVGAGGLPSQHAVLWQNGVLTELASPLGMYSAALAINDSGQAVGFAFFTLNGASHSFQWQNGTMIDLGVFNGMYTLAWDINASGQVVGTASIEGEGANASALLWQNGVMIDLNTLLPPGSGWHLEDARAITDCGQIVGTGVVDGSRHAFLLTPHDAAERCETPASDEGTEVPPASEVIDSTGGVWTLGGGTETFRNGVHTAGGYARSLLWTGGTLYALGWDDQWWRWNGSEWIVYGPSRPGLAPLNPSSPDGTEVPPADRLLDATAAVWTLGAGGETLRNGDHAAGGYARTLLWRSGTVYAFGWDDQWWQWNGSGWVPAL